MVLTFWLWGTIQVTKAKTCQAEAEHLGGQQEEEGEAGSVILAPVYGAGDCDQGPGGVCRAGADVDADDDEGMFLDAEAARVNVEGEFAQGESPAGKSFPCSADGEDEQLGYDVADR
ncbi:hypothetical protein VP1G_10910 [Cytospora mali]|uniref:Uncharacterized protein n=1 Tax=Cytospora mali TaxID=578113 RepID=A0A194V0A1_CYTMA|nr:hypothetical protein VP1G_10910 [Valsa mali var. pyri (nom. inval.)]